MAETSYIEDYFNKRYYATEKGKLARLSGRSLLFTCNHDVMNKIRESSTYGCTVHELEHLLGTNILLPVVATIQDLLDKELITTEVKK